MSQAQSNAKQIPGLKKEQNTALKNLTIIGYLEGTSFLLLLGIAMPLKYMMGIPEGVKYIGMAHGVLFIAYILMLMVVVNKIKMPLWVMPAGVLGSFLPFGPFIFDHLLKKNLKKDVKKAD
ncbi:integral membrane protein [Psychrobacter sp. PL15]|nr:integral membrane protein [Psychrobacter sp. PL15]